MALIPTGTRTLWLQEIGQQLVAGPMRSRDEKNQPHIGDGCLAVDKNLETERKDDGRPPTSAFAANAATPGEKQQRRQRRRNGRGKPGREIVFTKNRVTGDLGPINEGRFVEAI